MFYFIVLTVKSMEGNILVALIAYVTYLTLTIARFSSGECAAIMFNIAGTSRTSGQSQNILPKPIQSKPSQESPSIKKRELYSRLMREATHIDIYTLFVTMSAIF